MGATESSQLRNSNRPKVIYTPKRPRHEINNGLLERSRNAAELSNHFLPLFLEFGDIFAREDADGSIAPVLEGGITFLTLTDMKHSTDYIEESLNFMQLTYGNIDSQPGI